MGRGIGSFPLVRFFHIHNGGVGLLLGIILAAESATLLAIAPQEILFLVNDRNDQDLGIEFFGQGIKHHAILGPLNVGRVLFVELRADGLDDGQPGDYKIFLGDTLIAPVVVAHILHPIGHFLDNAYAYSRYQFL
jgi:hypothetical protein